MQTFEPDPKLEHVIHEELRQLPNLRAPESLAANILAAIRARENRPWWRRSWFSWPVAMQAAVGGVFLALLGLGLWAEPLAWAQSGNLFNLQPLLEKAQSGLQLWSLGESLVSALAAILQTYPWILPTVLGSVAILFATCVGLGTACYRVATNRL